MSPNLSVFCDLEIRAWVEGVATLKMQVRELTLWSENFLPS